VAVAKIADHTAYDVPVQ